MRTACEKAAKNEIVLVSRLAEMRSERTELALEASFVRASIVNAIGTSQFNNWTAKEWGDCAEVWQAELKKIIDKLHSAALASEREGEKT